MRRRYLNPAIKPRPGAGVLNSAHALADRLAIALLFNEGAGQLYFNHASRTYIQGTASGSMIYRGHYSKWGESAGFNISDSTRYLDLGPATNLIDVNEVTVLFSYKKTDATNRSSAAFGINPDAVPSSQNRCGAHLPYSDGNVYWDFGGIASGTSRLHVAGLTFSDNVWAFTAGSRGMDIWQDGYRRASQSGHTTWTASSNHFYLGKQGTVVVPDVAHFGFFYLFQRQLKPAEIVLLSQSPFSIFSPTRRPRRVVAPISRLLLARRRKAVAA